MQNNYTGTYTLCAQCNGYLVPLAVMINREVTQGYTHTDFLVDCVSDAGRSSPLHRSQFPPEACGKVTSDLDVASIGCISFRFINENY